MPAQMSLTTERFRKTFLAFFALCSLLPLLILLYLVHHHVMPVLTLDQVDSLRNVATYGMIAMLAVPILGFFLMRWWIKSLESLTAEIKARSREVLEHGIEITEQNEMLALKQIFDGLVSELQSKIGQLSDYSKKLVTSSQKLSEIAITDELSSLYNRRYFEERLKEEISRAQRHAHDLSLIMMDVDGFKLFNDAFGHPAGDKVVSGLGRLIRQSIRKYDVPFRYGGDEFAVILPQCPLKAAGQIAAKLVHSFASLDFGLESNNPRVSVSLSCGVAGYTRGLSDLVSAADRSLYKAKAQGKGRVVLVRPKPVPLPD